MTARETLRALVPILGEKRAQKLWHGYLAAGSDARRELEAGLEAYAARALNDHPGSEPAGLFPPPQPETSLGDIDLGRALYGGKPLHLFGLRGEELLRHVGLYGSSGSGKSNGIALILDGLTRLKVPFLLVDFKRTFRSLLIEYPRLMVFTAGDRDTAPFRFNPLIPPPGTGVDVWCKKVVACLSHAYCQGAGSESLLISALTDAYGNARENGCWPTFLDVDELLDAQPAKGRKGMWMDSARRAVGSLTSGNALDVFCPEQPLDFVSLLTKSVILELDLLNQAEQTFLSEALLLWIIQYRMNNEVNRESLRHVVLIEEAHHLLRAPPGMGDGSEPVIHIALREVRELGECIILATQNASIVPVSVFGNQATTIAFHTKHASDVRASAQAMLLKDEAKDELGRLPVGEAIVRIPRTPHPVHIRLQHRPIAKGTVIDADIRRHMAGLGYSTDTTRFQPGTGFEEKDEVIPAPDDKGMKLPECPSTQAQTTHTVIASPTTTPEDRASKTIASGPTPIELAMLRDIVEHSFEGVVQRIHRLHNSRRKGTAALKALMVRGMITPTLIFTGKGVIKLFDVTKEGRAVCHHHGFGPLPDMTEGGVEHRYWVKIMADQLRADGWTAITEYPVSDEFIVDVHAERNGQTAAYLVETGKSNVKRNIERAVTAGYAHVTVVSGSPAVRAAVERMTKQVGSVRVAFLALPATLAP